MAEKMLWNSGWSFVELPGEEDSYIFPATADWKPVDIPHDWMIYNTHDLYRDSVGWYKKEFTIDEVKGHFALRFDEYRVNYHRLVQQVFAMGLFKRVPIV